MFLQRIHVAILRNAFLLVAAPCCLLAAHSAAQSPSANPSNEAGSSHGKASFYSRSYDGRRTAEGDRFNSNALTAASRTLPLGSYARVENERNHKSVVVKINDRGPNPPDRTISLTRRGARQLGFLKAGTADVTVTPVERGTKR